MATQLPAGVTAGTYEIDPAHSTAAFSVRHAGIAKVRGTIDITSGTITVGDDVESSSVIAELDAKSVSTGDSGRDQHLVSKDFWGADENPSWTFRSGAVTLDGDDITVTGDLTINGISKPVELNGEFTGTAKDPFGNDRAGFEASTEINRKDFGITWNAALEGGGVLVGEKVKITLDVSAIAKG
ncbi:YceI family protein [Myceligenerans pegani]|uniref:YceI family protein n=1 Tax=Myceligenerans pegani TaxID=2776917 RepID=A0ABR9N4L9_9MICO|nr:YceI family protein [Myceligenerans sp. TRM 65318]MBE1878628.1 YceI family protein [Myceligenerans sp. TRM 65318]MBE3020899.1 YceI family protein [Myceligenerans sp. TRM 65318]